MPAGDPEEQRVWSVSWFATPRSASPSSSRSAMARSTGCLPAALGGWGGEGEGAGGEEGGYERRL